MNRPNCRKIAKNPALWAEYVDVAGPEPEAFDALSYQARLATIHALFGGVCNCDNRELAQAIYNEAYSGADDRQFRDAKVGEIADWLTEGDLPLDMTLDWLVVLWAEYEGNDD